MTRVATIFDYLRDIRARPSMFLGGDAEHRRDQMRGLLQWIFGYGAAVKVHGIADPAAPRFLEELGEYVREYHEVEVSSPGVIDALLESSESEREAWDRFWWYVDEYELHLQQRAPKESEP